MQQRNIKLMNPKFFYTDLYVEHIMFIVGDINVIVLSLVKVLLQVVSLPRIVNFDAKWVKSSWKSATSSSLPNNSVVKSRFSIIVRNSREFSLLNLGLEAF